MSDAPGSPTSADDPASETPEPEPDVPPIDPALPAPRVTAPTQAELDALPADRRLELMDLDRQEADRRDQRRHRRLNTWILAAGVLAAVGTLLVTALTLRSGQEQLNLAREGQELALEGQVTDRYTKAVEQLGSDKREVRTAAVYALERIAKDSEPDRQAIRDLLAAFIRERDPATTINNDKIPSEPDIDIAAALTVLIRRPTDPAGAPNLDLHGIRAKGALLTRRVTQGLQGGRLQAFTGANLRGADLTNAYLPKANLSVADLDGADLGGANLSGADLRGADLSAANLYSADLIDADLSRADLSGADLSRADLRDAWLSEVDLRGAGLFKANLSKADLSGADLRGTGLSEQDVRAMTDKVDGARFGPVS